MNRRRFLQGAGLTSLGFSGYVGGNRLVGSPERSVYISGTVRGDAPLSIGGLVDRQFTDSHPARVRFSVTNTGDRPVRFYLPQGDAAVSAPATPISTFVAEHDTGGSELLVIPEEREHFDPVIEPVPLTKGLTNCWHVRTTRWSQHDVILGEGPDPGESIGGRYTVLHHATPVDRVFPGPCLDTGSYHIRQPVTVVESSETANGSLAYRERSVTFEYLLELS